MRKLKDEKAGEISVSGTVLAQSLTELGLIDEYRLAVNPIVLGSGRTLFEGMPSPLRLKRTQSRSFNNGTVFVVYEPAK